MQTKHWTCDVEFCRVSEYRLRLRWILSCTIMWWKRQVYACV